MLFFYMITLLLIFVIQFSVACACLGVDEDKELQLAEAVSSEHFLSPMSLQSPLLTTCALPIGLV